MGFGDEIMTSAAVRELYRSLGRPVVIGRAFGKFIQLVKSPIWENNTKIHLLNRKYLSGPLAALKIIPTSKEYILLDDIPGPRHYAKLKSEDRIIFNQGHAVHLICASFRVTPEDLTGEIFLTDQEVAWAKMRIGSCRQQTIHIEPNVKESFSARNKDWGFDNWQYVVDRFKDEFQFVQTIHSGQSRYLQGVKAIFTKTFRQACAVLSISDMYVGPEGGLHHAAAALEKKAVVIFGGFISPATTGYHFHKNIYIDEDGSPCGMRRPCEHCQRCMRKISANMVINHIKDALANCP